MTTDLASLIVRIARAEPEAMLAFYDRTSSHVFGVIGPLISAPAAREQAMERIYLEVWQTAGAYDGEACSVGAWLINLAHRTATDIARDDAEVAVATGGTSQASLGALPTLQRACIDMTYYRGMTVSETSDRLGMSREATAAMLCDAVDMLATSPSHLTRVEPLG